MYIYKITNKINGKSYIGQTNNDLSIRFKQHCQKSSKCTALSLAVQKYGKENFTIEEISGANNQTELNYQEWFLVIKYNTLSPNGYNLKEGGGAGGAMHTTTKSKVSLVHKGKILSKETKSKLRAANLGKKLDKLIKIKIGNSHHGMKRSMEASTNISLSLRKDKRRVFCINNITYYNSAAEAGKLLGLDNCCVSKVLQGKRNHHKGYKFTYKD